MPIGNIIVALILLPIFLLLTIGGTGSGVVSAKQGYRALRVLILGPTPISDVRPGGWALVTGLASLTTNDAPEGPLSKRRVACADCRIERKQRMINRYGWKRLENRVIGDTFTVTDDTHGVDVDPTDAAVTVDESRTKHVSTLRDAFAAVFEDPDEIHRSEDTRYTERRIEPDDTVLIDGHVTRREGRPLFTAESGKLMITTKDRWRHLAGLLVSTLGWGLLAAMLLLVPVLFVTSFIIPRYIT